MTRNDKLVSDLCWEIDDLKDQVEYWKLKYDNLNKEYNNMLNESLDQSKKGVANALMFALRVRDSPNGDLIINKEDRIQLANDLIN